LAGIIGITGITRIMSGNEIFLEHIDFDRPVFNTLLGGNPDETISSRCGKKVRKAGRKYKLAYYLCRALHWFDKDHCMKSIEDDEL